MFNLINYRLFCVYIIVESLFEQYLFTRVLSDVDHLWYKRTSIINHNNAYSPAHGWLTHCTCARGCTFEKYGLRIPRRTGGNILSYIVPIITIVQRTSFLPRNDHFFEKKIIKRVPQKTGRRGQIFFHTFLPPPSWRGPLYTQRHIIGKWIFKLKHD